MSPLTAKVKGHLSFNLGSTFLLFQTWSRLPSILRLFHVRTQLHISAGKGHSLWTRLEEL